MCFVGDIEVFQHTTQLQTLDISGSDMRSMRISGNITRAFFCDQSPQRTLFEISIGDIEVFKNTPALKELALQETDVTGAFSD